MEESVIVMMIREYYDCNNDIAMIMLNYAKKHDALESLVENISKTEKRQNIGKN